MSHDSTAAALLRERPAFTTIETSNKPTALIVTHMEEIRAMHTNRIGAVVAIMFSGMLMPVAVAQENCMHPRIISVTGTAEIKVPPDEVQLTLGIDSHDKDLVVAMSWFSVKWRRGVLR